MIELEDLLRNRQAIAAVNQSAVGLPKEPMPPDVMAWFGLIVLAVADLWNTKRYTVSDNDLLLAARAKGCPGTTRDKWAKAINSLCDHTQQVHLLLMSHVTGELIINQPGLESFWMSEHIQALRYIYGGGSSAIRAPSTHKEQEWCAWLGTLTNELRKLK
jgi:hypothetical protein